MNNHLPQRFIFLDPLGKRWPRLRLVLFVVVLLCFLAGVLFVQALLVRPELRLPPSLRQLKGQLKSLQSKNLPPPAEQIWRKFFATTGASPSPARPAATAEPRTHTKKALSEIRLGFYQGWDSSSATSLEEHARDLTHVAPEWMTLVDGDGTLKIEDDSVAIRIAASRGLVLMPQLNNLVDETWQPEAVEAIANGPPEKRAQFILKLLNHLQEIKAGGVVIDWEQIDPAYQSQITALLTKMADALHAVDKELWLVVPMGEELKAYDLAALAPAVDHFVALLFDENGEEDMPGPVASQAWFEGWLEVIKGYGEPGQWIGTIGTQGYDWTEGKKRAEVISFADAMSRASYAGIEKVEIEAPSYNPSYSYEEPLRAHSVWFLDALTFCNQLNAVRAAGLGGIALSRLGSEDPHVWDVLHWKNAAAPSASALKRLEKMTGDDTVTNVGQGEIVTVDDAKNDGLRAIVLNADGRLTATYTDFPTYPILYHQGAGDEHEVSLTFDDGPDPKWTPQVLDILKANNVHAAFFLVGNQAEEYPNLVERIAAEGHEIGNHTYTHANLAEISAQQTRLELNATQRLIESLTGRSTTLFRPPYNADSRPNSVAELAPLKLVQDELGYLMVLENIDPEDWARPGADVILDRVKQLRRSGNIILLHDAGGNRAQTIEALPKIIEYLRTRGDRIVSLGELLNIPRDDLMPPVKKEFQTFPRLVSALGFTFWRDLVQFLWAFMIAATALILIRTLLVATLAALHHRRDRPAASDFAPAVSVIIAAYNEGKVIRATLQSVLDTDYMGPMDVVVIDDGSTDDTAAQVRKIGFFDRRVLLVVQPNRGKPAALENGLQHAQSKIAVFLDADTQLERKSLERLVRPLIDERVGAVSGHARVGNLRRFIARCQSLEYICGFNLDRRAYAMLNCITVVPGAISAVRIPAIEEVGGFSHDTLAEDTDLTLSLHRKNYRVEYAADAIAWTEAPETIRALARQRFRWAFGTLQCLWKHRDLIFSTKHKALGWFSLPSVWFFQIALVALTPIVDSLLVLSLLGSGGGAMWYYFITFLVTDLILAIIACALDGEKIRKAWTIIPMRLLYRPLLGWVIWRAIFRALQGAIVTWGKLDRTASMPARVS